MRSLVYWFSPLQFCLSPFPVISLVRALKNSTCPAHSQHSGRPFVRGIQMTQRPFSLQLQPLFYHHVGLQRRGPSFVLFNSSE